MKRTVKEIVERINELGLTAYALNKEVPISIGGLRKILNGESTNPTATNINALNDYLDSLIYPEQQKANGLTVNESSEIYLTKSGNVIEELGNGNYLLNVPIVPYKAQATYISEHTDAEFVRELSRVSFIVDRVPRGRYMAWEVVNDSMNDGTIESIPHGSIVLGREVSKSNWRDKLNINGYKYWIIVHKDTIVCKEITNHDVERGTITCHSLNESVEYGDFELELNDCHQLFNIIKKQI